MSLQSLHNFNPNNKSWKMYSNTLTSISGDNLNIKPYDGRDLLLEVSGNNEIIFKRGDISYNLDDLMDMKFYTLLNAFVMIKFHSINAVCTV